MPPELRPAQPFHLWILHEPAGGSLFTVRYEVYRGMGALRLGGIGAVTPSLKRGRLRGLSASHLKDGRFLLFSEGDSPTMKEIPIWTASTSPEALPADEWTLMAPARQGMLPHGWQEQEPPEFEDDITDLTPSRGLDLAFKKIKARKQEKRELKMPAPGSAPLGLVRHLQGIIDQQRAELEELRARVARLQREQRDR